jgi:N-glycosylase/DNA lyase
MVSIKEIKVLYQKIRPKIASRLSEFKRLFKEGSEEDVFAELAFCILTPQSKAISCWECVETLKKTNLLFHGNPPQIAKEINKTRFKNNKAKYIVEARKKFLKNGKRNLKSQISRFENAQDAREWLVNGVKGIGYKEASHFLRNIGFGLPRSSTKERSEDIAILDRHILRNLKELGVIKEIPSNMSKKKYLEIERKMKEFSRSANIPLSHLDLVFWYKETGGIFK